MLKHMNCKLFDCQDMPDPVRVSFFKFAGQFPNYYNGSCIKYVMGDEEDCVLIDKWLTENGAGPEDNLIIEYWW